MDNEVKFWAIVPAAGTGSRMQTDCPKQYLELMNKPVLIHTLERLGTCPGIAGVGLGISADDARWAALGFEADWLACVCDGGAERAETVSNILQAMASVIADRDWVLVHDAARPCVTHAEIISLMKLAARTDGGLLGRPLTDTIKLADETSQVQRTVPREGLWRAHTPQMFRYKALRSALQKARDTASNVTDEASAMEQAGSHPLMVEGRPENIKITLPGDLELAEIFMQQQEAE
jgi:2-C-methyl-D-erythritol 4-phosphate cytidylyltransferase